MSTLLEQLTALEAEELRRRVAEADRAAAPPRKAPRWRPPRDTTITLGPVLMPLAALDDSPLTDAELSVLSAAGWTVVDSATSKASTLLITMVNLRSADRDPVTLPPSLWRQELLR